MGYERIIELVKSAKKIVDNELLKKDIHMKGAANFVTAVDTEISRYLKERLKEYYPEVGFFSEEEEGSLSDPCWILDPIDGTTNLVYGYNMSTVSLALYQGGRIQFGVVFNPFNGECFTAESGMGAYLDGHRIHVSQREMAESIIEFGAGSTHKENAEVNFEIAKRLFIQCIDIRRICSSALSLCYIAAGRIDGYFEKVLKPWDYAAGTLILQEAGGELSDYYGADLQFANRSSIIAGNGKNNRIMKEIISEFY